jgi:hypothetical protein
LAEAAMHIMTYTSRGRGTNALNLPKRVLDQLAGLSGAGERVPFQSDKINGKDLIEWS